MTYTTKVSDLLPIAIALHEGQMYSEGDSAEEYIQHVLRVVIGVEKYRRYFPKLDWDIIRSVAIMHDTMEDCNITVADCLKYNLAPKAIEYLQVVTRNKDNETYDVYIERVGQHLETILIKLADLQTNIEHSYQLGERGVSLRVRWEKAKQYLINLMLQHHADLS